MAKQADAKQTDIGKQDPPMSEGQRAYEARRAAKAGMSLDRWLEQKRRAEAADEAARARETAPTPPKKPGFLSRLIDRAHKPL